MSSEPPLPQTELAAPITVICKDCHRPLTNARARRRKLGAGCWRKSRARTLRRRGRFIVDQEPLPEDHLVRD